jgi:hypothetical protein
MQKSVDAAQNHPPLTTMWLAWAGWQMRVPLDWRPLTMHGTHLEGSMMLGTGTEAVMHLKWWQPPQGTMDTNRWIRERLKKITPVSPVKPRSSGAVLTDFKELAWVPPNPQDAASRSKAIWYGQALTAPLIVEIVLNVDSVPRLENNFLRILVPSLKAQEPGSPSHWAVFNVSFISPSGYSIKGKRLFPGDMSLWFDTWNKEQLLLRQIYPIQLALNRQTLEQWLERGPIKDYHKFKPSGPTQSWEIRHNGKSWQGIKRTGYKRLAFPLGNWRAKYSQAAIVNDMALDRLLLCEYDSLQETDDSRLKEMITSMNWAN